MSHDALSLPNPPGLRRGGSVLALLLLTTSTGAILVARAQAARASVPAITPLAVLLSDHVARTSASAHGYPIETVAARRPLTGVRTVLPVLGYTTSSGTGTWAHVRLPGRPNGAEGWISTSQTRAASTEWHITIDLSTRRVTVYYDARVERRFPAVVGKPSTPTPRGQFFIEEAVALAPQDAGAPFALATSARSNVLQEFDGGPGQIAIHGTNNLSGAVGTASSHGCVRISTGAITWLSQRIGSGVPLTIAQ